MQRPPHDCLYNALLNRQESCQRQFQVNPSQENHQDNNVSLFPSQTELSDEIAMPHYQYLSKSSKSLKAEQAGFLDHSQFQAMNQRLLNPA